MPSYVIHLATANEYMKNYPLEINDKNEFLKGVIAPDLTTKEGKKITHYGPLSSRPSLRKFLQQNEISTDYDKGYFLHLVTDYIFYNKMISYTSKEIYNDYDILNLYLIEKYNVSILDEIENNVFFKKGELKIINKKIVEDTIKLSSSLPLYEIKKEIFSKDYNEKWEKIRKLTFL